MVNSFQNPSVDTIVPRSPVRKNYLIRVGQSLNLTCPYEVPFYSWTHADQPTKILSDQQRLSIRAASTEHSGRYVCQAVDGYGANSADFAVRVIDPSSNLAQRECALKANGLINVDGPCFLTSYSDRDLNPTKEWGDSITLDCDSVTSSPHSDSVYYRWDVIHTRPIATGPLATDPRRLLTRDPVVVAPAQQQLHQIRSLAPPDLSRFSEPQLKLDHLTLRHTGEYRCSVIRRVTQLDSTKVESISRTFRLQVKPRSDGYVILGERTTNKTVDAGKDVQFKCEVNPEEHRSSTIRWGKSIDITERSVYESAGHEVIQWAGGTFVVLPSLPMDTPLCLPEGYQYPIQSASSTTGQLVSPRSGAIATEASSTQVSQLCIRQAKASDAGRYVCSVLTEAGRDDHKFVHLTVTGASGNQLAKLAGGGMKRLTVYIAVPIAIFFICLCVVTYCLVSRRTSRRNRRPGHRRQRNFYSPSQTQIKSASAASSSSIGVCRNGTVVGPTWNGTTVADPRMRPSPAGQGSTTLCYSSTNGSNSLPGAPSQLIMTTQGYQNVPPGSCIVPGSYPMMIQQRNNPAFYGMPPDQHALPGYPQHTFPNTTHNEYVLNNNAMNAYPSNTLYQLTNGHGTGTNAGILGPNLAVPSSPESSALTASPVNSEAADGRLLYQLGQQTSYPGAGFPGGGSVGGPVPVTGANFGYPAHNEFDPSGAANSLLPYRPHPDAQTHGNTTMRA